MGLLSSICLSIFALLLFIEYYFEEDDDSDEDGSQEPIEVGEITKRSKIKFKKETILGFTESETPRQNVLVFYRKCTFFLTQAVTFDLGWL